MNLKSALYGFYLAKSKESLRLFEEATAIEQKMQKNMRKGRKEKTVIDLDHPSDDEVEMVSIGVDEEASIKKFVDLIVSKSVLPAVQSALKQADSLDQVKDERLIDLIDLINKFDSKQQIVKSLVPEYLTPLYEHYVRNLRMEDF